MPTDKLFDGLGHALRELAAELREDEREARRAPRNDVAYYTTKRIRERLEELMRLYSVKQSALRAPRDQ